MSEKKDYIERGAALAEAQCDYVGEGEYCGMKDFVLVKDINAIPAADVEPVVRGEWVHLKNNVVGNSFNCTICNHEEISYKAINPRVGGGCVADGDGNFYYKPKAKFCPNCGARMERSGEA